jgi:hypothetical protein
MPDTLWCVHILGPDDLFAEPSFVAAVEVVERFNAYVRRRVAECPLTADDAPLTSLLAVVVPWPGSAESHAAELARGDARYG